MTEEIEIENETDLPPPSAMDAERATLGSIFINRDSIIAIAPWFKAEYFFSEWHAWIYEAQIACFQQRIPPDVVNVADEMRRRNTLHKIGGPAYLVEISNSVPTSLHIEYYARVIEEKYTLRKLINAAGAIAQKAYKGGPSTQALLSEAEGIIQELGMKRQKSAFSPMGEIIDNVFELFMAIKDGTGAMTGVPTGFRDLDELTGGLQKSDLIILAARPAVGKSSLAHSIAMNAAKKGANVGIFTLEMSRDQVVQRIIATETGLDLQKMRTGDISDSAIEVLTDGMGRLVGLPIYVNDTPALSVHEVRSLSVQLQMQHGLDLIVIDYLQLMHGKQTENRVQEVSDISRGLKALARELNVPVLALSQLSRAVEGRTSHVPMLSDLRESGSIEQDADLVMFIYREELYDPESTNKGVAEVHLAKHRNGPVGIVPLRFFSATTRFCDLERYRQPEGY